MRFTKMHGAGNDYVYVNCFEETVGDPAALARAVSPRHTGIGGDGLILILPSDVADARMRMFNADGSEAEMCGNGVRCVAKFVHDHGISAANPLKIETGAGVLTLTLLLDDDDLVDLVTVDMGEPRLAPEEIPTTLAATREGRVIDAQITVAAKPYKATCVSMGNPHAVVYLHAVGGVDLAHLGPAFEHHPAFPERVNLHLVEVHNPGVVTMRTWERGSGITQACGTGAAAVCVAGVLTERTDRRLVAHLPGGDLELEWDEATGHVFMTGPAVEVFSGEWSG